MSNNITLNPLKIDTADPGILWNDGLRVRKIRWVGATTAGHRVTVEDQYGNLFWESICPGPDYVEESDFSMLKTPRGVLTGLIVEVLDSGTLYIYQ